MRWAGSRIRLELPTFLRMRLQVTSTHRTKSVPHKQQTPARSAGESFSYFFFLARTLCPSLPSYPIGDLPASWGRNVAFSHGLMGQSSTDVSRLIHSARLKARLHFHQFRGSSKAPSRR